jgi:hypothetical protein
LKWLLLNSDLHAVLSEFARVEINLEDAEAKTPRLMIVVSEHEENPVGVSVSPVQGWKPRGSCALNPVASDVYTGTH